MPSKTAREPTIFHHAHPTYGEGVAGILLQHEAKRPGFLAGWLEKDTYDREVVHFLTTEGTIDSTRVSSIRAFTLGDTTHSDPFHRKLRR